MGTAPNPSPPARRVISYDEAATYTGVCKRKLVTLVQRREVPHIRIGRSVTFLPELLDEWLKTFVVPAEVRPPAGPPVRRKRRVIQAEAPGGHSQPTVR